MAAASILTKDLAAGARNAVAAIDLAEDGMASAGVRDRLDALWLLAQPHEDDPDIAAFRTRLHAAAL